MFTNLMEKNVPIYLKNLTGDTLIISFSVNNFTRLGTGKLVNLVCRDSIFQFFLIPPRAEIKVNLAIYLQYDRDKEFFVFDVLHYSMLSTTVTANIRKVNEVENRRVLKFRLNVFFTDWHCKTSFLYAFSVSN
jgi:hypothetical protein